MREVVNTEQEVDLAKEIIISMPLKELAIIYAVFGQTSIVSRVQDIRDEERLSDKTKRIAIDAENSSTVSSIYVGTGDILESHGVIKCLF